MPTSYLGLLRALAEHRVEHVVVGGVAAILAGAPITTLDLDVLYDRAPENLERLGRCLRSLGARYRDPAGRRFEPTGERLATLKTHLLLTDHGPLDLMTEIGAGATYADLLSATHVLEVGDLAVRVLDLAKVIETKEHANRDKDRAMLPLLRHTLELQRRHAREDKDK
jgi:hypothetical protein